MQFFGMFDDFPQEEFPCINFSRSVSDDNLFSNLLAQPSFLAESFINSLSQNCSNITQTQAFEQKQTKQLKKIKKDTKKVPASQKKDYRKNICGYITKKIVREFISQTYQQRVQSLCQKYNSDYLECKEFYFKHIERITGPTHLDMLIIPNGKSEIQLKLVFKQFLIWFLRHRYMRYLLSEGKMDKKEIYIDYKNKTLLFLASGDLEDLKRVQMNEDSFENRDTSFLLNQ